MTSLTVYGPVCSWRLGSSLGIDLLHVDSICSFRCIYCQLGKINVHTTRRRVFVSTERVIDDLRNTEWTQVDAITFSGSGEPTLAYNLGDAIRAVRQETSKPIIVLTNSATLSDVFVRRDLCEATRVFCKLDAATDQTLARTNRPAHGITVEGIVRGIDQLRQEFNGHLAVQIMLTRLNLLEVDDFAALLNRIRPNEVQLNTPLRGIPVSWQRESRGEPLDAELSMTFPKPITREEADSAEQRLKVLTGLKVNSVYRPMAVTHEA